MVWCGGVYRLGWGCGMKMPRSEFRLTVFASATILGGWFAGKTIEVLVWTADSPIVLSQVSTLGAVPGFLLWVFLRRRARRRLVAADFLLCPKCDYPLNRLGRDSGACPECGTPFEATKVRRTWRRYYRSLSWSTGRLVRQIVAACEGVKQRMK